MRVAVTGATGIVGQFVVARLLREGCDVVALVRPGTDRRVCPGDPEWVEGELDDPAALTGVTAGAEALVHCALDHLPGRYRGGEGDDVPRFWRINLGGTVGLLEAAAAAGVARTVLFSSRAVFGAPVEGPIDDAHAPAPTTHYGALKAATEALAGVYDGVAVLRPTGVYGIVRPFERTKWAGFARAVLAGGVVPESRAGTEVHGEDLADAVWLLLTAPSGAVADRVFNCSDLEVDTRGIVCRMQAALGRTGPVPPAAPPVGNVLRCDALQALGWRPGGEARLHAEIETICAKIRVANADR